MAKSRSDPHDGSCTVGSNVGLHPDTLKNIQVRHGAMFMLIACRLRERRILGLRGLKARRILGLHGGFDARRILGLLIVIDVAKFVPVTGQHAGRGVACLSILEHLRILIHNLMNK